MDDFEVCDMLTTRHATPRRSQLQIVALIQNNSCCGLAVRIQSQLYRLNGPLTEITGVYESATETKIRSFGQILSQNIALCLYLTRKLNKKPSILIFFSSKVA